MQMHSNVEEGASSSAFTVLSALDQSIISPYFTLLSSLKSIPLSFTCIESLLWRLSWLYLATSKIRILLMSGSMPTGYLFDRTLDFQLSKSSCFQCYFHQSSPIDNFTQVQYLCDGLRCLPSSELISMF